MVMGNADVIGLVYRFDKYSCESHEVHEHVLNFTLKLRLDGFKGLSIPVRLCINLRVEGQKK